MGLIYNEEGVWFTRDYQISDHFRYMTETFPKNKEKGQVKLMHSKVC